MKEDLISIIVPIYNVEKYLEKCIRSLIHQSYSKIEILLIDDGSTDECPNICDKFEKEDSRIKTFHKENGGLSDARNKGIEESKGEYITFVDSDDYLDEHYIEILYNVMIKNNADLVISGLKDYYDGEKIKENLDNEFEEVLTKQQVYRKMFLQDEIDVNACGKLYQKQIFENLKYPKDMLYEDIQIIDDIIERCDKIVYTTYKGYNYLQRTGSIMYGKMSPKRMSLISKTQDLIKLMKKKYPSNIDAAIKRYVYCNFHVLGRAILDDRFNNECKVIRKNILEYKKNIFKENIYTKKEKMAIILLKLGLWWYKMFWMCYCKCKNKKI